MSQQALWISVSPTLKRFHRPLQTYLSRQLTIQEWAYQQAEDEPCSLDIPLTLLHDYLKYTTSQSIFLATVPVASSPFSIPYVIQNGCNR